MNKQPPCQNCGNTEITVNITLFRYSISCSRCGQTTIISPWTEQVEKMWCDGDTKYFGDMFSENMKAGREFETQNTIDITKFDDGILNIENFPTGQFLGLAMCVITQENIPILNITKHELSIAESKQCLEYNYYGYKRPIFLGKIHNMKNSISSDSIYYFFTEKSELAKMFEEKIKRLEFQIDKKFKYLKMLKRRIE